MATCKFNIGDTVRRIGYDNTWNDGRRLKVGTIGTVVNFDRDGGVIVKVGNEIYAGNDNQYFALVTKAHDFNVGDKIVITNDGKTTTATLYKDDGSKESATARCAPEDTFDFSVGAKLALERLTDPVNKDSDVVVYGFKVGDRVNVRGMNGTIICITKGKVFGVQFDDENYQGHRCIGVSLIAGSPSRDKHNCWWVTVDNLNHGEAVKPIELWNGRAVCIKTGDCPGFTEGKIYKVKDGRLIDDHGDARPMLNKHYISKPEDLTAKDGYFASWDDKFIPIVE